MKLELAHFTESMAELKQAKVGAASGKTAIKVAIQIAEQIKAARKMRMFPKPNFVTQRRERARRTQR